ncbi:cobalamin synthesis [Anopheles sinensis]|uniref:Cobalamin synthesis n=1 Tax=Anopheles sinensis TaxID=74873 RepID=A0A084WGY3_ANOSI|nr:cobalamin synthesis [Anopheles sinensis]
MAESGESDRGGLGGGRKDRDARVVIAQVAGGRRKIVMGACGRFRSFSRSLRSCPLECILIQSSPAVYEICGRWCLSEEQQKI